MSINDRILELIEYKGLVKNSFSNNIGIQPQTLHHIVGGRLTKPSFEVLEKIVSTYSDINPTWLITGEGEMLKISKSYSEASNESVAADPPAIYGKPKGVPLVPTNAIAGIGSGDMTVNDYEIEYWYSVPDIKGADYIIRVKGDSMKPRYKAGDVVACKKQNRDSFIQWNEIYVLDTTQGILIKRVRKGKSLTTWVLHSDNPEYDDIEINAKEEVRHFSLVLGGVVLE